MEVFTIGIVLFIWALIAGVIIYLIARRAEQIQTEDFEKRDN